MNVLADAAIYVKSDEITRYLIPILSNNTHALSKTLVNRVKNEKQWLLGEEQDIAATPVEIENQWQELAVS